MELYIMRYVLAVAEYRNFSLAAQACHVGQPALSQQIAKLEKELGVALFQRNARGAVLTEAGQAFVLRAREILQLSDALKSEMSTFAGLRRGTLNLGVITSLQCIDFGGLLSGFCSTYPGISINIVQGGTHELLRQLTERKLDIAFVNRPVSGIPAGITFQSLGKDIYHLAVPDEHPLAGKEQVSLTDFRDSPFIFHQTGQVAAQLCLNACRDAGFEPNIVCRSSSPTMGLYMVRGGLGVALLPAEEFRARALDGICELSLQETICKETGVAWRSDSDSRLVDVAVNFAQEWVEYA